MNRPIRQLVAVLAVMFLGLAGSTTAIQFFQAASLNANAWNVRTLYREYGTQRGPIIVAGESIVSSQPIDDAYNYLRVYERPEIY